MKKLLAVLAVLFLASSAQADGARGAKAKLTINFSATAQRACLGPAAVYSVLLGSGTNLTDFGVIRDSGTANTTSSPFVVIASTQSGQTYAVFDPPIQLKNGISFNVPATMQAANVEFECGPAPQGY